ncbi:MAG: AraC family transcriptional regulator [Kiritimatiellae bacterium]|jgi:AraC-like DNA-binding protein|nr:AraC family transcriptional regulator [Kiritimatiellia bacterium]
MATTRQNEKHLWGVRFYSPKMLEKLPYSVNVSSSRVSSKNYFFDGNKRVDERNTFVFQYTIEGYGEFKHNNRRYQISHDGCFLTNMYDPEVCYYYPSGGKRDWVFVYFIFKDYTGQTNNIIETYGHVFDFSNNSHLIQKLLYFKNTQKKVMEISNGESTMLVNSVLCSIMDVASQKEANITTAKLIRNSYHLIEENKHNTYTASMLAEDLDVSQEHLNRVFAREINTTPYKLIVKTKIYEACLMLKESSLPVKNIAQKLGYPPEAHFGRIFKRKLGITPGQFRKTGVVPF